MGFGVGDQACSLESYNVPLFLIATTFLALFIPTPVAMRVLAYRNIPEQYEIKCVIISKSNCLRLMEFIDDSFQLNAQGNEINLTIDPSYGGGFYVAKGSYSIVRNCNDWTAKALRLAGVNTPIWSTLSSSIMYHINRGCNC